MDSIHIPYYCVKCDLTESYLSISSHLLCSRHNFFLTADMACSLSITTTYPPASLEATNVSSHVRLMAAGKCTAKVKVGILEVECPCAKGLFSLYYQKDLGDKCNQCHHPITDHEDVGLDESLGPLTSNNIQRKGWILSLQISCHS